MHQAPTVCEIDAIHRLFLAARGDGAMSEVVAKALLSTWRPEVHGHLNVIALRELSEAQRSDVIVVLGYVISAGHGLDELGLEKDMAAIAKLWGN